MEKKGSLQFQILDSMENMVSLYDQSGNLLYCNLAFSQQFSIAEIPGSGIPHDQVFPHSERKNTILREFLGASKDLAKPEKRIYGNISTALSTLRNEEGELFYLEILTENPEGLSDTRPLEEAGNYQNQMIAGDSAMAGIMETIQRISQFDSTILISGESGTGKSMLAKFIHQSSRRSGSPFITINCATIPENLIESELFGYVAGAFTGAQSKGKQGMVEQAHKGTLFLDEIGLLPLNLQSKFLQLIQDKTYTPVGGVKSRQADIRIISATNLDLKDQITKNLFREDLYYRLRVIEMHMPPLRERPDALEPMIQHFLGQLNQKYNQKKNISKDAIDLLRKRPWHGNVRELQYLIELLFVTSPNLSITPMDIASSIDGIQPGPAPLAEVLPKLDKKIESIERELINRAYSNGGSSYKAAEILGISQTRASKLIRKYITGK